jgi:hypothetical protein
MGAVLLCVLLLLSALRLDPAGAQSTSISADTSRVQELDTQIEDFFKALKRGTSTTATDTALRDFLRQSSLNSSSTDVAALQTKVDECKTKFGEILAWEKYENESKRIGTDVMLIRYVLKYDQYPVIWTFKFYRKPSAGSSTSGFPSVTTGSSGSSTWVLIALHFDTDLL